MGISNVDQEYSNHSLVYLESILGELGPLECFVTNNTGCCGNGTGGHWYHPDGTQVSGDTSQPIHSTRGGLGEEEAAVNLYWGHSLDAEQHAGLFRCEIPAVGANGDIQITYIGLYRGDQPNQGTTDNFSL